MSDFVIGTKKLTKIYGEQTAVNSVDIHVKPGRIYGLLGRNGAGKTTIMKMILGLTPITSGEVDVFGQNIKGHEKRIYPRIGAIIETPGFYPNLTGTENLEIFAKLRGTPRPNAVKNALEVVGLPYRDKKLFSKYSLGMKQRLGIANAILHDPELLILDEPTNGLDPIGIAEVRNFIKELSVERGKRTPGRRHWYHRPWRAAGRKQHGGFGKEKSEIRPASGIGCSQSLFDFRAAVPCD